MRRWEGYVNVLKQCRGPWADCQKIQSAGGTHDLLCLPELYPQRSYLVHKFKHFQSFSSNSFGFWPTF